MILLGRWMRFIYSSVFFFFFFFQAEDGIRDYKVTGVQTCALPICRFSVGPITSGSAKAVGPPPMPAPFAKRPVKNGTPSTSLWPEECAACPAVRSEERRVGKESRELWGR